MTGSVSGAQLRAFIERIERLEEEKRTIADDIKEVKAEAKGCGFDLPTINAILKLRKKDAAERDEAQAMLDLYMSALGMLPLFERDGVTVMELGREPAQAYSEAKGRGDAGIPISETGELTDNQKSGRSYSEASISAVSHASDESETDDVGATASSTNSAHKPAGDLAADKGDKDRGSFPVGGPAHSNSPGIPLAEANSAGEAPSSSPASSARHSDDDIPAFIKQDKPDCLKLKDGHCRLSFATSALCAECNQHRAISRASA